MTTTTTDPYPAVAPPPGATFVGDWDDSGRYFRGQTWTVADGRFEIIIDGNQNVDGSEERFILVAHERRECLVELTADRARQIGQALIEAADAVDQSTGAQAVLR
jgi:hypothetical protein